MNQELWLTAGLLVAVAAVVVYTAWRGRRQSTVFQEVERMAEQVEELTLRVVGLELNLSGYRVWNAQLRGQVVELGGTPVAPPPWLAVTMTVAGPATENLLVSIYHRIHDLFTAEEVSGLAFQIGLGADELGGETRSARARQLVETAYRNHRLLQLVREARRERPDAEWPSNAAITEYQASIRKEL